MKAAVVLLCVLVSSATAETQRSLGFPTDDDIGASIGVPLPPGIFQGVSNIVGGAPLVSITNGMETGVNEYPWQAALVIRGTSEVFCGGSIISSKHILTAGHCTYAGMTDHYKSRYQVLVGAHSLTYAARSQQRLEVSSIIHHPDYDHYTLDNDISIIKLKKSISFTSRNIQPVSLPYSDTYDFSSVIATVAGWGVLTYTHHGASPVKPDVLMAVDVPTMDNDRCEDLYGDDVITSNMLCAGHPEGGKDSCQGDSGGPLVYFTGSCYHQIGIVSFGRECGLPDYSGVYTRVTKYLSWISENTACD